MHNIVSNGHFLGVYIENSEKKRDGDCFMIAHQMSTLLTPVCLIPFLPEVVWQSCKLKNPR